MALTDEQIAAIMSKEIKCKSILVDSDKLDEVLKQHQEEGWILVKKTPLNDRFKLTFKK